MTGPELFDITEFDYMKIIFIQDPYDFFPAIAVPGSDFSSGRKQILLQGCLGARRFLQAKPGVNHRPHF